MGVISKDNLKEVFKTTEDIPGIQLFFIWVLSLLFWYIDVAILKFNGIDPHVWINTRLIKLIFESLLTILFIVALFLTYNLKNKRDFFSNILLSGVIISIVLFDRNISTILHLMVSSIFILFFYSRSENKTAFKNIITFLIVFDFFGYGLIDIFFNPNPAVFSRVIIPIWPLFVLIYGTAKTKSIGWWFVWFVSVFFWVVLLVDIPVNLAQGYSSYLPEYDIRVGWNKIKDTAGKIITGAIFSVQAAWQRSIINATGEYYGGNQERSETRPLGVYLKEPETDMQRYFVGDPVSVWVPLKATTLDKTIDITIDCYAKDGEDNIFPADNIDPSFIDVYSKEDYFISCDFNNLAEGYYEITIKASFNFLTSTRLRVFLMNKETVRALRREGKEIFDEYPFIENANAVYTEGPVELGMETVSQPIIIDPSKGSSPYIGITLGNLWDGIISEVIMLELTTPDGTQLDTSPSSCDFIGSGQTYTHSNPSSIGTIDYYRSFRCKTHIDIGDLDLRAPVTTGYFQAAAEYIYTLTETIDVEIEPDV
ncbi:hypothetical protein GF327_03355 [Candidatus Woesearchaeota archaeon]|nr:hypothetical protein [Candidatus Woesearchaeota archaeon]